MIKYDPDIEYTFEQLRTKVFQAFEEINHISAEVEALKANTLAEAPTYTAPSPVNAGEGSAPTDLEDILLKLKLLEEASSEKDKGIGSLLAKLAPVLAIAKPEVAPFIGPVTKLLDGGLGKKSLSSLTSQDLAEFVAVYKALKDEKDSKKKVSPQIESNDPAPEPQVNPSENVGKDAFDLASVEWDARYARKFGAGLNAILAAPINLALLSYKHGSQVVFTSLEGDNMGGGVANKGAGYGYHTFAIEKRSNGTYFSEKQDHSSHGVSTRFFEEVAGRKVYAVVIVKTINKRVVGRSLVTLV